MKHELSRTKPNRQILSEASAWFVTFRFDDADAAAREQFCEWLRRSPEHIQAYLEITGIWAELPGSDPAGRIDIQTLISRARVQEADVVCLENAVARAERAKPHLSRRTFFAASAALVGAVAFVVAWFGLNRYQTYSTEIGEQRSVTLADGSTMDLNAHTRVRVHFSERERDIELVAGQALFQVAKDKARPFVVRSAGARVRAVGTQFDVYRKKGSTVVTVLEGRVAVVPDASVSGPVLAPSRLTATEAPRQREQTGPLYLSAGEQVVVTAQAAARPKHTDVGAAMAWVQKKMVFEATPLSEVAEEFNRYNTRALVIEDPRLASLAISGVYSSTDPTSLLRFLRDQPGVVVLESDKEIRITSSR